GTRAAREGASAAQLRRSRPFPLFWRHSSMLALQFIGVAAPRPRRPRVLVAEDHGLLRRAIKIALERDGYDVIEAADGEDLIRQLHETTLAGGDPAPDLILSDH